MLLQLSEATAARRRIPVFMADATDGYTEEPGLTLTVTVSKNGAAFAASAGTVTEIGNGNYYYEFAAAELNTLGLVQIRATGTGARNFYGTAQVIAFDPYDVVGLGLTNVDVATSTRSTFDPSITPVEILASGGTAGINAAELVDAVWDEALSGHAGAGTAGKAISDIEVDTNDVQTKLPTNNIMGSSDKADHDGDLAASQLAQVADAVWDELLAGHVVAGSSGEALANAGAAPTAVVIADAVWDEALVGHAGVGTAGKAISDIEVDTNDVQTKLPTNNIMGSSDKADHDGDLAASQLAQVADAVWDEALAGHVVAGSSGEALARCDVATSTRAIAGDAMAITSAAEAQIVDAVWDEAISGHLVAGSFGEYQRIVAALAGLNSYMDTTSHVGGKMTAARIRCYKDTADVPGGTPLATVNIVATYAGDDITVYESKQ